MTSYVIGQNYNGKIKGRVYNAANNEPIPFANLVIWQTNIGSVSDLDGNFLFTGIKPGFVELRVSAIGYKTYISEEIMVTNSKTAYIDIPMQEENIEIETVEVTATPFRKAEESPVSLRRIGVAEIEKSPGANRDISKVIQSFPGVGSTVSFRNDLIVRGGGPSENSFYLDGVEFPNLNHFATQGASGGPAGILNVDFISSVNYYSGAFPANRVGALSSVFEFKQKSGNKEKMEVKGTIGASDLALTLDGPLTDNTTYIFSVRRSYLQLIFSAIGLPFLPVYNDLQFKTRTKFDDKNELILVGVGAYDENQLNLDANETEAQRYILKNIPVNEQWSYTVGAVYKHYGENGYDTYVLSRNTLDNRNYKYKDNIEVDSLKTLDYNSTETENKFRYEHTARPGNGFKINYGLNLEQAIYTNSTFRKDFLLDSLYTFNYDSELMFYQWGAFGQISKELYAGRLTLSLGTRIDGNNYMQEMYNPLKQFSPRFSASYLLTDKLSLNFNTGRYYQLPPYTTLGFRNNQGELVNKQNDVKYIASNHLVGGMEYLPDEFTKISIEGFYKWYEDYPFSLSDSVSIASKGGGFGVYGDEEVVSIAEGRAYGAELLVRRRLYENLNVVLSYTLVRSEFKDYDSQLNELDAYTPTSWDSKHLLNLTVTKSFKRNWDIGFKWRYVGGLPYTPIDYDKSTRKVLWDIRREAYLDYSRFNEKRLEPFHQLDLRVDKQYFFKNWSLMFYVDVQNVYNFKADEPDRLSDEKTDGEIVDIENPQDPEYEQRYELRRISNDTQGTVFPTIGIIIEF